MRVFMLIRGNCGTMTAEAAEKMKTTVNGLFIHEEDLYLELQKWKRCASP